VIGVANLQGGLFFVNLELIPPPTHSVCPLINHPHDVACFAKVPLDANLWHARMGHSSERVIPLLPEATMGVHLRPLSMMPFQKCEPCIIVKHMQVPHPPSNSWSDILLGLIHCDLCGPMPVHTPDGKVHFILFLNDQSNSMHVELLASKGQVYQVWLDIKGHWETKTGKKVLAFWCDNAKELISHKFNKSLADAGIERQFAAPYAHQQNGKGECTIQTLEEHTLAMITSARLPLNMWGEAVLTAAYLLNCSVTRALPSNLTPYKVFNG
jgi:transposase InsO family protein